MRLINLKIFPIGKTGWSSDLLEFGTDITQIYGPNGCGKTPLVQTIVFCLGYPSIFRQDIYDHCSHAILTIELPSNETLHIKRIYSRDVDIEVTSQKGVTQRFFDEREYSLFLFECLNLEVSKIITIQRKPSDPYIATLLPLFYLDQDNGYSEIYSPPSKFIKDQFSEMVRIALQLPEKNSFEAKKLKILAKERLDNLDKKVVESNRKISLLQENKNNFQHTSKEITEKIKLLEFDIEQLKSTGATQDNTISVFDRLISRKMEHIGQVSEVIFDKTKRIQSVTKIIGEINSEIETLNLNEEAKRVFLSFKEICGSNNCKLFSFSSESYSKNLLYLKDQIKDLERNSDLDTVKLGQLEKEKQTYEEQLQELIKERNKSIEKSEISELIDTISRIKSQIFELESQRSEIEEVEQLKHKHVELLNERDRAFERYQSFSKDMSSIPEIIKAKADLRSLYIKWLDILKTNNISRDITFKDEFIPVLGSETISQLKGSTRSRAVLAYHAALLELILSKSRSHFRFMILDTPKQHEMHSDDLDRYLKALKKLAQEIDLQIIFSTTEYHYHGDSLDKEWNPKYPGEKHNMFLRTL